MMEPLIRAPALYLVDNNRVCLQDVIDALPPGGRIIRVEDLNPPVQVISCVAPAYEKFYPIEDEL